MTPHDPERTADLSAAPADRTPTPSPSTAPPADASASNTSGALEADDPTSSAGYTVIGEVGRGGKGVVYRARDTGLGRDVALKVLAPRFAPDSPTVRRFLAEARITGQQQHPGIPSVHQVVELPGGRPFLAMKLI